MFLGSEQAPGTGNQGDSTSQDSLTGRLGKRQERVVGREASRPVGRHGLAPEAEQQCVPRSRLQSRPRHENPKRKTLEWSGSVCHVGVRATQEWGQPALAGNPSRPQGHGPGQDPTPPWGVQCGRGA